MVVHLLGDVEVFVSVGEVERRLFEVAVDDASEVAEALAVGCGRSDQQEAAGCRAGEMLVTRHRYTRHTPCVVNQSSRVELHTHAGSALDRDTDR